MNLDGEFLLAASRQEVWDKLNDTQVLKKCIPGCETLDETSDNSYQATIRVKVGPVNAKFKSEINIRDVNEPESYTLSVKSKGGAAGMGEGLARVSLVESGDDTQLNYSVEFKVQGKLAQIGSRLLMNVIQKMSNEFFSQFAAFFPEQQQIENGPVPEVSDTEESSKISKRYLPVIVILLIVFAGLAIYFMTSL